MTSCSDQINTGIPTFQINRRDKGGVQLGALGLDGERGQQDLGRQEHLGHQGDVEYEVALHRGRQLRQHRLGQRLPVYGERRQR